MTDFGGDEGLVALETATEDLATEYDLAFGGQLPENVGTPGGTAELVGIAWALHRGEDVIPLVGARTRTRTESLGALDLTLSTADLAEIERAVPLGAAAGRRYPDALLAGLDSEVSTA